MMRTRQLRPGFFTNEDLARCDPLARILYEGLWCMADREGRLEDRPERIKAEALPYDDCKVTELLDQLVSHGFIVRYEAQGRKCLWIPTLTAHQHIHPHEAASVLPAPAEDVITSPDITGNVRKCNHTSTVTSTVTSTAIAKCPEAAKPPSGPAGDETVHQPLLTFPTVGKGGREWVLTSQHIADWREAFPSLDVLAECRKALAWVNADPKRRKTADGMKRFLVGWMGRSQNRGGGASPNGRPSAAAPPGVTEAQAEVWRRDTEARKAADAASAAVPIKELAKRLKDGK